MISPLSNVNWLAVAIAFFAYFLLGALWFTVFFKRQYEISLGKENMLPQKPAPIFIVGPAICSLLIVVATALLMSALQVETLQETLGFATVVDIGYLVANTFNIAINPNMPNPIHYAVISSGYHLVGIYLASAILFLMR